MSQMSMFSVFLIISSMVVLEITGEEKFCQKDRKLLLGGVFNYDKIIFGYSWKEVNSVQLWLVWRYEYKNNQLIPIGEDVTVDQIFPTIPLFRAGFGLTMKRDTSDNTCKSYRQLVFIFFQTSYRVFRFANDVFATEVDKSKLPWGLKTRGESSDWFFGSSSMDNINAIMFMGGYQSQIFIVSKDVLYVSSVDIKAPALKWTKLAENKDFGSVLGGIVIGSDLFINKNEAPDSMLLKYDNSGKELEKVTVWEFFGCDEQKKVQFKGTIGVAAGNDGVTISEMDDFEQNNEKNNSLATIVIIIVVVVIVLTNMVAVIFWVSVYRRKSNNTEN